MNFLAIGFAINLIFVNYEGKYFVPAYLDRWLDREHPGQNRGKYTKHAFWIWNHPDKEPWDMWLEEATPYVPESFDDVGKDNNFRWCYHLIQEDFDKYLVFYDSYSEMDENNCPKSFTVSSSFCPQIEVTNNLWTITFKFDE